MAKWIIGKRGSYSIPDYGEKIIDLPDGATPIGVETSGRYAHGHDQGSLGVIIYIKPVDPQSSDTSMRKET